MFRTTLTPKLIVVAIAMLAGSAHAAIQTYSDESAWLADMSSHRITSTTTDAEFSMPASVTVAGGGSALTSFSAPLTTYVVGSSWATWVNQPTTNGLPVYFSSDTTLSFNFQGGALSGTPVDSFGFYLESNIRSVFNVSLGLASGQSVTQTVDGNGGAKFFGWSGSAVNTVTLTADPASGGFAFGHFYEGVTAPVPEPETYAMLLAGLGVLGTVARRRQPR